MDPIELSHDRLKLRRQLLGLLTLGYLGTGAELWLLEHTEGFWQKAPFAIIAFGLLAIALHAFARWRFGRRLFQAAMWLALAGGVAGLILHFRGNMEFELEMYPDSAGWPLIWKTLKGATPALAPGMMILLGLLGLVSPRGRPASGSPVSHNTPQTS